MVFCGTLAQSHTAFLYNDPSVASVASVASGRRLLLTYMRGAWTTYPFSATSPALPTSASRTL